MLGFTEQYWVMFGFTEHWTVLSFNDKYWVMFELSEKSCAILSND